MNKNINAFLIKIFVIVYIVFKHFYIIYNIKIRIKKNIIVTITNIRDIN